jgi:hypothetical protein
MPATKHSAKNDPTHQANLVRINALLSITDHQKHLH